jgi:hypothetical protein
VVYQLPFGQGRKYGSNWNAGVDSLFGGWEVNTNAAAFAVPSASAPFGNLGRKIFRGPNFFQWDLGVNKNFRFLNHTNFGLPD